MKFVEQFGATLEQAAALLEGQTAQSLAMDRLYDLVGDGVIVSAAFGEYPHSDELTVFVVDEAAVAVVTGRVVEAGLDSTKTTVEIAPDEPPYDPWDWLDEGLYAGYEWLQSPGPHTFGAWQLVESWGVAPDIRLVAGFGPRWFVDGCSSWLGRAFTSAAGRMMLTVDREDLDCRDATEAVEQLVTSVIEENGGEFAIASEDDDRMIWRGSTGDTLVWQQLDDTFEPGIPVHPVYPADRSEIYETWIRSFADEMESVWQLQEVGDADPAAPVTVYVGVSTMVFEGQCNDMQGFFAISADNQLGTHLSSTLALCPGPTGEVEEQMKEVLWQDGGLLEVSIEADTMTWSTSAGLQMIWSR